MSDNATNTNHTHAEGEQAASSMPPLATECAFLVFIDGEGHWQATAELGRPLQMTRPATINDFFHAAADITGDIEAFKAGNQVLAQMEVKTRQMMEAQQNQAVLGGIDLSKIRG